MRQRQGDSHESEATLVIEGRKWFLAKATLHGRFSQAAMKSLGAPLSSISQHMANVEHTPMHIRNGISSMEAGLDALGKTREILGDLNCLTETEDVSSPVPIDSTLNSLKRLLSLYPNRIVWELAPCPPVQIAPSLLLCATALLATELLSYGGLSRVQLFSEARHIIFIFSALPPLPLLAKTQALWEVLGGSFLVQEGQIRTTLPHKPTQ
jgi:hypothetical protein